MKFEEGREFADKLDNNDPLKDYRSKFHIPKMDNGREIVYLCGNSLGLQPKDVDHIMNVELDSWKTYGVEGHHKNTNWINWHEEVGQLCQNIVGGNEEEIIIMNTLTVNLHLMMVSFYRPTPKRFKILTEEKAFPSDQYAVKSQIAFHGFDPIEGHLELKSSREDGIITSDDVEKMISEHGNEIALIMIGGVNYYTGQVFDMQKIVQLGHEKGCIVGFDLAHGVGNIELALHDWGVDFAVWCTYKYLNGGPGSIAGCFIHEKHLTDTSIPRFEGWWGTDKSTRFLMGPEFVPIKSAEAWQLSNAPIFSMAPLKISFKLFNEIGMSKLVEKSKNLTNYLQFLIEKLDNDNIWITPKDSSVRGCQISIHVRENGKKLYQQITKDGVICDWREPDVIRIAPVPIYNSFEDVFLFYNILKANL